MASDKKMEIEVVTTAADFADVENDNALARQGAAHFRPQNLHLGGGQVVGEVDAGEERELGGEVPSSGPLDAPR